MFLITEVHLCLSNVPAAVQIKRRQQCNGLYFHPLQLHLKSAAPLLYWNFCLLYFLLYHSWFSTNSTMQESTDLAAPATVEPTGVQVAETVQKFALPCFTFTLSLNCAIFYCCLPLQVAILTLVNSNVSIPKPPFYRFCPFHSCCINW